MTLPSKDQQQHVADQQQHVAVCPSAGVGHLVPFLRLASILSSNNCKVTLITIQPTLTLAETNQISDFLTSHPNISSLDINIDAQNPNTNNNHHPNNASTTTAPKDGPDPFFLRYATVSRSAHLLTSSFSTLSPPLSAVFSDIMFASGFSESLSKLNIPNYLLCTSSCRFFSLITYLSFLPTETPLEFPEDVVNFPPGISPVPKSSVPPPFFNPNHVFTKMLISNSSTLDKMKGIVFNSFNYLEPQTVSALKTHKILPHLPPIYPIGPLRSFAEKSPANDTPVTAWLAMQPERSVLYVSFGSRTAMSVDQIKELGTALERSGERFLWVVKITKVDKDDKESSLDNLLGEGFLGRVKEKGLVLKEWVDQEAILDHPAIGGFVTHCGWNSVMEAAQRGVPVLAWPQHGDQKVNAEVVAKAGLGVWEKEWGWTGERLVKADEILEKIKEVMRDDKVRASAEKVGDEAVKAWDKGGSSHEMLTKIIEDIGLSGRMN